MTRLAFAAALAALCAVAHAEMISTTETVTTSLEDCGAMETIELNMIKARIADCRRSAVFHDAVRGHAQASDALCDATTTCGNLLPYLAHMKTHVCVQRAVYDEFSGSLLELCDAYPYRSIDPKSVLVGKPPRSDL